MDGIASRMDGVVRWRERRLREAGVAPSRAARIARDPRVDVHALIELVERGCEPRLAERIVAPLDPAPADGAA